MAYTLTSHPRHVAGFRRPGQFLKAQTVLVKDLPVLLLELLGKHQRAVRGVTQ